MADDKYENFDELSRSEVAGVDYRIFVRGARLSVVLVAPHGGGIEPGSSEIADAVAGEELSYYGFEGIKSKGNSDLHITSTNFDEPMCLALIRRSVTVVTIHGEETEGAGEAVFVGGRDLELGELIWDALSAADFPVARHTDPLLQGLERRNICNRGISRKGVQLELASGVRKRMFKSLSREGRKFPTPRFHAFVDALRGVVLARG